MVRRLKGEMQSLEANCEFFYLEYGDALRCVFAEGSDLVTFDPQLLAIHLDLDQIKPNLELTFAFETREKQDELVADIVEHIVEVTTMLRKKTGATLLVSNLPAPPRSVLGIGLDHIFKNALRRANLEIESRLRSVSQCHVIDCDSLWAEVGWRERDRRLESIAQMSMGSGMQKALVAEWLRYYRAIQGLARKCIVLDLDNTLWKGILGEDGPEGLQMGDTPEGRGFRRLQLALKALRRRGVVLAINSKNTFQDAIGVIQHHPDMVLREEDFAAMQINWDDKSTNVSRIVDELNISTEHVVFLDDNPSERAWVRQGFPDVMVPELPKDSSSFSDVLMQCNLDTLTLTEEDSKRTQMYRDDRERRAFQVRAPSYEQFLDELNIQVCIESLNSALLGRAVQLCQRTNQFNLTTRRYTAEQLHEISESTDGIVLMMTVGDRFGEYGWSGLATATLENEELCIDSLLVSCRVLGKNVELALFSALVDWAELRNCTTISGAFMPTAKNGPCADFYSRCGMVLRDDGASHEDRQLFFSKIDSLPRLPLDHVRMSISFPKEECAPASTE